MACLMRTAYLCAFVASVSMIATRPALCADEPPPRKVTKKITPVYSAIAQKAKLTGTVKLLVAVAADGTVKNVRILGGNAVLAASAEEAVKRWKFEPLAKESTEAIAVTFTDPK